MLSFEEAREALSDIADSLPRQLYKDLCGGVILLPRAKLHPGTQDLYILGEYHYDPCGFGRYIALYYGSFRRVFGNRKTDDEMIEEMGATLRHELTHHIESLAGDKSLEYEDEARLEDYYRSRRAYDDGGKDL